MDTFSVKSSYENKFGELKTSLLRYYEGQESEILGLQSQLEQLSSENKALRAQAESVTELQNEVLEAVQDSFKKEIELQKSQNRIDELQLDFKNLKTNYEEAKAILDSSSEISERQIIKITKIAQGLEDKVLTLTASAMELAQRESTYIDVAAAMHERSQQREIDIKDLEQKIQNWKSESKRLRFHVEDLDQKLKDKAAQSEEILVQKQKNENEISNLWENIAKQNQMIIALSQESEEKQGKLEALEEYTRTLTEKLNIASTQISALKKDVAHHQEKSASLEITVRNLRSEFKRKQNAFAASEETFHVHVAEIQNKLKVTETLLANENQRYLEATAQLRKELEVSFKEQIAFEQSQKELLVESLNSKISNEFKQRDVLTQDFQLQISELSARHEEELSFGLDQEYKRQEEIIETFKLKLEDKQKRQDEIKDAYLLRLREEKTQHEQVVQILREQIANEKNTQDEIKKYYETQLQEGHRLQEDLGEVYRSSINEEQKRQDKIVRTFNIKLERERKVQTEMTLAYEANLIEVHRKHDDFVKSLEQKFEKEQQQQVEISEALRFQLAQEQKNQIELHDSFNAKLVTEIESNVRKVLDLEAKLENELVANAKLSASQKKLEKQMTDYMNFMNQEKSKNQLIIGKLAHEIQQAISLHPLRDYLAATEKELSKVECELKKTPTLSGHRDQLENIVGQLISQRDYLKDLILKTEKHLVSYTGPLDRLSRSGFLGMNPPPPTGL